MPLDLKKAKPSKGGGAKLPVYGSQAPMTAGLPAQAKDRFGLSHPRGFPETIAVNSTLRGPQREQQDSAF
jgi:hypothetical protein